MKNKSEPRKCIYCEKMINKPKQNSSGMCCSCSAKTSNDKNKLRIFKQKLKKAREFWG
ncbi:MAG: hypothetical protein ACTSQL_01050 [Promethearchaeota archaeon]